MSHQGGRNARLNAALHAPKASFENAGKGSVGVAELADSSAGCERVQALAGEKGVKMLGERDGERTLHDSEPQSSTALVGK